MTATIDDTASSISYSSGWVALEGATRQWDGTVHSTSAVGATATFSFHGTPTFLKARGSRFPYIQEPVLRFME